MSNMKKWGATLAFVALVAAASPATYKFLSGGQPSQDPAGRSADARAERTAGRRPRRRRRRRLAQPASQRQRPGRGQSGSGKVGSSRLGVMPRNRLPGGGFHYDPSLNARWRHRPSRAAPVSSQRQRRARHLHRAVRRTVAGLLPGRHAGAADGAPLPAQVGQEPHRPAEHGSAELPGLPAGPPAADGRADGRRRRPRARGASPHAARGQRHRGRHDRGRVGPRVAGCRACAWSRATASTWPTPTSAPP